MDKLRVAATGVAERAARAGPVKRLCAVLDPRVDGHDTQRGQGLAEYALILSGVAILAIASLVFLGEVINDLFVELINEGFRTVLEMLGG